MTTVITLYCILMNKWIRHTAREKEWSHPGTLICFILHPQNALHTPQYTAHPTLTRISKSFKYFNSSTTYNLINEHNILQHH